MEPIDLYRWSLTDGRLTDVSGAEHRNGSRNWRDEEGSPTFIFNEQKHQSKAEADVPWDVGDWVVDVTGDGDHDDKDSEA